MCKMKNVITMKFTLHKNIWWNKVTYEVITMLNDFIVLRDLQFWF